MNKRLIAAALARAEMKAEAARAREALELRLLERMDCLQAQIERLAFLALTLHGDRCVPDPSPGLPVAPGYERP